MGARVRWIVSSLSLALVVLGLVLWLRSESRTVEPAPARGEANAVSRTQELSELQAARALAERSSEEELGPERKAVQIDGASVIGLVLERMSAEPVAGVRVRAVEAHAEPDARRPRLATTDGEGAFRIEELAFERDYRIEVAEEPAGYLAEDGPVLRLREGEEPRPVHLWVARPGRITGTVTRRTETYHPEVCELVHAALDEKRIATPADLDAVIAGSPVRFVELPEERLEGVRVTLSSRDHRPGAQEELVVRTDETGRFELSPVLAGRYLVRVSPPPGGPRLAPDDAHACKRVQLMPGAERTVDFLLPGRGVTLEGRVVDPRGMPVAGARIEATGVEELGLCWEESYGDRHPMPPQQARSDAHGRFVLSGLMPPDFNRARDYALTGECSIDMVALTARTEGLVPARIVAPPWSAELGGAIAAWRAMSVRLHVELGGGDKPARPIEETVLPSFQDGVLVLPDLVLMRGATLSGHVQDTSGATLAGVELRAVRADSPAPRMQPMVSQPLDPDWVRTDASGAFRLLDVPAGLYSFQVRSEPTDRKDALEPPLELVAGMLLSKLVVTVPASD